MPRSIFITHQLSLNPAEIREEFFQAGGPGGQNVNKVATAVRLYFNAADSSSLSEEIKHRLAQLAGRRMTAAGQLVIEAHEYRTQEQNRLAAQSRLIHLLRKAAVAPKSRKKTRPTLASRERRLANKKRRSELKRLRGGKGSPDPWS